MAKRCEETGPTTQAQCTWYTPHANHSAGDEVWPNESYGRYYDRPKATSLVRQHSGKATKPDHVDPAKDPINRRPGPIVRTADPANSHEAADRYEPKRGTARARVLDHLRAHPNEWIDAVEFTDESVGGFAGTRRLRELRDLGWPIETRPRPEATNVWQHRLVVAQDAPRPMLAL